MNCKLQEASEKQLKDWLTAEATLKMIGVIDEVFINAITYVTDFILYNITTIFEYLCVQVNAKMLNNIIEEEDDCFVFFYEEMDPEASAILAELEGGTVMSLSVSLWSYFDVYERECGSFHMGIY